MHLRCSSGPESTITACIYSRCDLLSIITATSGWFSFLGWCLSLVFLDRDTAIWELAIR
jgi:hypothetical protein